MIVLSYGNFAQKLARSLTEYEVENMRICLKSYSDWFISGESNSDPPELNQENLAERIEAILKILCPEEETIILGVPIMP